MIWIKADISLNIYKFSLSVYNNIPHSKITELLKIENKDTVNQINKDSA